jgi:hypothetical protein
MAKVIRFSRDRCQETQLLLPWYVTGQLDDPERAKVAAHLEVCARCRAELKLEQRLEAEVGGLPLEVERGWAAIRRRVAEAELGGGPPATAGHAALAARRAPWAAWGAAAGLAIIAAVLVGQQLSPQSPAAYHALSNPAAAPPADMLVVFKPDARAADVAAALRASGAQIADGPNAADAFALRVAPEGRPAALSALRASPAVALAEPISSEGR